MSAEEIYDAEIAPLLKRAGELCQEHGLAIVAFVQWDRDGSGTTAFMPHGRWAASRVARYGALCRGNVDLLMIALQRDAEEHGAENSLLMRLLTRGAA